LDLWASDNYENAFWCIPREDGKTRYPVTLLVPDALTTNQEQLDQFNGVNYTEEQFLKRNPGKLFNCVYPPKKPIYERGIEWLKIVRLPAPTAKPDSEINETIVKIIENTILECRKDRRILVFNPLAFRNETQMYRTLELIVRNLNNVAEKHFQKIEPKDVGKQTRDQLTKVERSWDKMCVLIREMGELAPAKLKGDKSGQSLLTKKAILQFIRKVRHHRIWIISDWQKATDVEDAIRQQGDIWILKKYTRRLGGDEWKWAFDHIEKKRNTIFQYRGNTPKARYIADSNYPQIDELNQEFMYVIFGNDKIELCEVPKLKHRHKEPSDSFAKITGVEFGYDQTKLQQGIMEDSKNTGRIDEKALYNAIYVMRHPKTGKKKKWDDILHELAGLQTKGEISWNKRFVDVKENTISKWFTRSSRDNTITPKIPS